MNGSREPRRAPRTRRAVLGEHGERAGGAADHGLGLERRRVVADSARPDPQHFRVISFDNRGGSAARSPAPTRTRPRRWPTTPRQCWTPRASSRHTCMDLARRHGRPAARAAPSPTRALAGARRHPCGRPARRRDRSDEVIEFFRRRPDLPQEEAAWASVPYNYGPRCRRRHPGRIAEDIAQRLAHPFPAEAYRAQLYAARCTTASAAWPGSTVPTIDRARAARSPDSGWQCGADGRSHPESPARDPRAVGAPLPHRAAGRRRGDLGLHRRRSPESDEAG